MAAFDKVSSGFPTIDQTLDYIRMGDNVVWQVTQIEEFRMFAEAFARQVVSGHHTVHYIRFAQHPPLLPEMEGVEVSHFDAEAGFEAFTVAIHDKITQVGRDAFYVFDCLSELQSVWYTDLMMGNFFCVTCPYLFALDTVAYFPLIRGRHSFDTVARIRDTTQILIDVSAGAGQFYLHPLKVWKRYSTSMFMPHSCPIGADDCKQISDGVALSRYYQSMQGTTLPVEDQSYDSFDRFFNLVRMEYRQGRFKKEHEEQIILSLMTRDKHLVELVKRYFGPEDYFKLRDRMIGSGAIGGKACGMLLARQIIRRELPEYAAYDEPHDSFYIGSDVFYTYIVNSGCWEERIRQRTDEGYLSEAGNLKEKLLSGTFPEKIREQFQMVLDYYGKNPYIVRSSSFLEDGFGNAFAGKYESVFCVGQGSNEQRMEEFEQAVRRVYASTMNVSALAYRKKHQLQQQDEQMAVLVQRVSGSYYGDYFFPNAAGVGYSRSAYRWHPDMDVEAGMLRLVIGLGTKAVDRTGEDYPRLVSLDAPEVGVYTDVGERHKFSQRNLDVLDRTENRIRELRLDELLPLLPAWYKDLVLEHDTQAEYRLRQTGRYRAVYFVSCRRLIGQPDFTLLMRKLLKTLERVYDNPVDIEFTVNADETGAFVVNLLQCRPLPGAQDESGADSETFDPSEVLFDVRDSTMGPSGRHRIDYVIWVDPIAYYEYPYAKKYEVAAAVGLLGEALGGDVYTLLMVPGRIGTSSPELGVPVSFADIANVSAICEVSESRAGYNPELSYGSHMFQDLIESEIFYAAILNNEKTIAFHPELLQRDPDLFAGLCPKYRALTGIIRVTKPEALYIKSDRTQERALCGIP